MTQLTNLTQAVECFMRAGEQTVLSFNATQATLYTGLQLEEMAEKLEAVATGCVQRQDRQDLLDHASAMRRLSHQFKTGRHRGDIMRADRDKLLDADIDIAWVSLGGVFSTARDGYGAIAEVARANLAKMPNGKCVKDPHGKIVKPMGWRGPDLTPFLDPWSED